VSLTDTNNIRHAVGVVASMLYFTATLAMCRKRLQDDR
jgi:hypothetical protein